MKKGFWGILIISILTLALSGFISKQDIEVTIVSTSIDKSKQTLRYDIKIKATGSHKLNDNIELAVKPWKDLEKLLVIDKNNKYKISSTNSSKNINENSGKFHLEYKIKNDVEYNYLMDISTNANLFVIKENKVINKVSLKKFRNF